MLKTTYLYANEQRETWFKVERLDEATGKKIIPYHWDGDKWITGLGPDENGEKRSFIPYPYHADRLPNSKTVFIVEGEKCADALQEVFDQVTKENAVISISGGSNNWKHLGTFADRFNEKPIFILPDNDAPGVKAERAGVRSLLETDSTLKLYRVRFDRTPDGEDAEEGDDVADYIQRLLDNEKDLYPSVIKYIKENAEQVTLDVIDAEEKQELKEKRKDGENSHYPIEAFPKLLRDVCETVSETTSSDISLSAVATLSVVSVAMGHSFTYSFGNFKKSRCNLHSIIICRSSGSKSPVIRLISAPIMKREAQINRNFNQLVSEIKEANKTKKKKDQEEIPTFKKDIMVTNSTPEGLMKMVGRATKEGDISGTLFLIDEISSFFEDLDGSAKGRADLGAMIKIMDGEPFIVRRADVERECWGDSSHVVILGGTQPKTWEQIIKKHPILINQGFIPRFLFTFATKTKKPVIGLEADKKILAIFDKLIGALLQTSEDLKKKNPIKEFTGYSLSDFESSDYQLSREAVQIIRGFCERNSVMEEVSDEIDTYTTKANAVVLKIALLFQVVDDIDANRGENRTIEAETLKRAIQVMDWHLLEYRRVLELGNPKGAKSEISVEAQKLLNVITSHPEGCCRSTPEINRLNRYKRKGGGTLFKQDTKELEEAGLVISSHEKKGGREYTMFYPKTQTNTEDEQ